MTVAESITSFELKCVSTSTRQSVLYGKMGENEMNLVSFNFVFTVVDFEI